MTFKAILKYYLIWQVLILAVVIIASGFLPVRESGTYLGGGVTEYHRDPLLNFRSNFDGVHFILIATHGYNFGQQAFFPLYPKLISWVFTYVRSPVLIGVVISSFSFFLALIFLVRLIEMDYPRQVSRWTVLLLLFFPTSFFFSSVYTEGLCLLWIVLSFYTARRGKWLLAGIFGALAAYTRLVGVFLFPALIIEYFWQSGMQNLTFGRILTRLLPLLLIPLSLGIYMFYLYKTTGDALAFYHVQTAFNQSRSLRIVLPYQVIWRYLKMITTVSTNDFLYLTIWLEFIVGIVFITLTVFSLFRQRLSYSVFSLFALFLPTLTGNFVSLPRYVLVCFPLFIVLGDFAAGFPRLRYLLFSLSGMAFFIYLSLFAFGYWVA